MSYLTLPFIELKPFPFTLYLCLSEKEWNDIKFSLEATHETWTAGGVACCRSIQGGAVISVDPDEECYIKLVGHIVHECMHAFQALCEAVGEEKPSDEFEAYTMQFLAERVLQECEFRRQESTELATGTQ